MDLRIFKLAYGDFLTLSAICILLVLDRMDLWLHYNYSSEDLQMTTTLVSVLKREGGRLQLVSIGLFNQW